MNIDGGLWLRPSVFGFDNMKKYLLISRVYGEMKRGAFYSSEGMASDHPEYLESKEDLDCKDLETLQHQYRRLIFTTQSPRMYNIDVSFIRLKDINHIIYIRDEFNIKLFNSMTNGFHYYLQNRSIQYYVPFIYSLPEIDLPYLKEPCIGFYYRPFLVKDASTLLREFLDSLSYPINIYLMGYKDDTLINHRNVKSCNHTYDNKLFFKNITHYLHVMTQDFIDPFPNTLMESVKLNKQIILFGNHDRKFKDGIDDIKEFIRYHTNFKSNEYIDNSMNHIFISSLFKGFYKRVFDNNFEYRFNRFKYKTMKEWVEKEVVT